MRSIESAFAGLVLALAAGTAAAQADPVLARDVLRELVAIRTVHPDGDNTAAARAAARRLLDAGFDPSDVRVMEPAPLKGNLVARLRGTGEARPLLLLAHIDVVDALREGWSEGLDPWVLTERDGFLYGRGVLDDKASAAMFVAVLAGMKRAGFRPKRDIILALTADEEGGTHNGVGWLLKEHRVLIDAEFALNEGGGATLRDGRRVGFGVQVSEKMYLSFELEATHRGGHSSVPGRENAIYDMAGALERISRLELPARLGVVARAYAASVAGAERGPMSEALRAIANGSPTPEQLRLASTVARYNAQFRTTCVATRIEGGHADNALPMQVKSTVNCRLLPEEDEVQVRAALEAAAGERVKVRPKNVLNRSPATDPASPVMAAIEAEVKSTWAGVRVLPIMSPGATDGSRLRNAGIPVYGVLPLFMEPDDFQRAHGRDERVPARGFDEGVAYFDRLVRTLANGP